MSNKPTKTTSFDFVWNWRAEMLSIIRFLEDSNPDNKSFARKKLMELADKLDEYNKENKKELESPIDE